MNTDTNEAAIDTITVNNTTQDQEIAVLTSDLALRQADANTAKRLIDEINYRLDKTSDNSGLLA